MQCWLQRRLEWLCLFAILLGLSACQPTVSKPELVFALSQAPVNLDPRIATDAASERVNRLLYQRLVEFDVASRVIPGVADWQQLEAKHYRFRLHSHLPPFHHGKVLTAEDVKATYDSLLQLADSPHRAEFQQIDHITTPDAHTIDFHLNRADPHFAARLIIGILPADLIAHQQDFSHAPVGNGGFRFVRWQKSLQLQRVRDGMWLKMVEVKDPNVRVLKLMRGEVDLLQGDLPPELVKYLQRQTDIIVHTHVGANFSYLGLNLQDPQLKDVRVRQAIAHAINTRAIIEKVMVDHTRPADAILPPEHYAGNAQLVPYDYQPAKARQLLQAAGVQLPLKLIYKTSTDAQRVRLATILQAQMQPAGIALQIKSLDWGTFFADVQHGHFQLFGLTWVGIKTPEIYRKVFASDQMPPNGLNRGHYQDASLDALLSQEDWPAITRHIHQLLPYIPLWYEGQFAAYRQSLKNYLPAADGNWDDLQNVIFQP